MLVEAAGALHDSADIGKDLRCRLAGLLREEQLLDLLMLPGWYHAISFIAIGAPVALEGGAPRFAGAVSTPSPETDAGQPADVRRQVPPQACWLRSCNAIRKEKPP